MATGISIHVGVNELDHAHYKNLFHALAGAEADALAMADVAQAAGFAERTVLLGRQATADAVKDAIRGAVRRLKAGDLLLITYAGHGSRVVDGGDFDDEDDYDETWCTYDHEIIDDELYALWTEAAAGTRIVVVSDSCFSGDVVRDAELATVLAYDDEEDEDEPEVMRGWVDPFEDARNKGLTPRGVPPQVQRAMSVAHGPMYGQQKQSAAPQQRSRLKASVLLLSACTQNELAVEKDGHGVFTRALLDAWSREDLSGGYHDLQSTILRAVKKHQSPGYIFADRKDEELLRQPPFFIDHDAWRGRAPRLRSAPIQPRSAGSVHRS